MNGNVQHPRVKQYLAITADSLFHDVLFLLVIAGGQSHLLLPLVVHHLLDHAARLTVQVRELGGLRLHLARVDLRVRLDQPAPPLHLVHL